MTGPQPRLHDRPGPRHQHAAHLRHQRSFADPLRGRDGPAHERGDTLRGSGGNDSIDGGSGVDTAEFLGNRHDYTVTKNPDGSLTVRDNNPADGNDGTDVLTNVERLVFADEMLSFGSRAEEVARVAAVLWTPGILNDKPLFAIAFSFYDKGKVPAFDFAELCRAALNYWTTFSDLQLAQRLKDASGTSRSVDQMLETMAAAGGGMFGRAAAVAEAALDPATTLVIEQSGLRETGVVSANFTAEYGNMFGPWAEPG